MQAVQMNFIVFMNSRTSADIWSIVGHGSGSLVIRGMNQDHWNVCTSWTLSSLCDPVTTQSTTATASTALLC